VEREIVVWVKDFYLYLTLLLSSSSLNWRLCIYPEIVCLFNFTFYILKHQ